MIPIKIQSQSFIIRQPEMRTFDELWITKVECDEESRCTTVYLNRGLLTVILRGEEHDNLPPDWTNEKLLEICCKKLNVVKTSE
jgi:hypothetical protein